MNPDGGAVPQTFKIASPDDKKSPSEPVAGEPATVALPKVGENPIPPKAVASSKISSRILGWYLSASLRKRPNFAAKRMTRCAISRHRDTSAQDVYAVPKGEVYEAGTGGLAA